MASINETVKFAKAGARREGASLRSGLSFKMSRRSTDVSYAVDPEGFPLAEPAAAAHKKASKLLSS